MIKLVQYSSLLQSSLSEVSLILKITSIISVANLSTV
jgi:hypothetical protein